MSNFFNRISEKLRLQNLKIKKKDLNRPWGGFFDIDEDKLNIFTDFYFNGLNTDKLKDLGKISLKILIIAPNKRLSWQYHHRRSEIWKVTSGEIRVVTSHDNLERNAKTLQEGDEIRINQSERHRIIGTDEYAIVAEIWIHTNKYNKRENESVTSVTSPPKNEITPPFFIYITML